MHSNINATKLERFLEKARSIKETIGNAALKPFEIVGNTTTTNIDSRTPASKRIKVLSSRALTGAALVGGIGFLAFNVYHSIDGYTDATVAENIESAGFRNVTVLGSASKEDCRLSWFSNTKHMVMRQFSATDMNGRTFEGNYCKHGFSDPEIFPREVPEPKNASISTDSSGGSGILTDRLVDVLGVTPNYAQNMTKGVAPRVQRSDENLIDFNV